MNILFVHGGGPTPVINSSLFGGVMEAKRQGFDKILGAIGWIDGIINERFVDFNKITEDELELLLKTPGLNGSLPDQLHNRRPFLAAKYST